MKKNTARPKSIIAAITLVANQISPAWGVTRPCRGRLWRSRYSQNHGDQNTGKHVHLLCFPAKVDKREGSESWRATSDESSVGLMSVEETSLRDHI